MLLAKVMKKDVSARTGGEDSVYNKNLRVESGETVLLSPESGRFQSLYKEVHPRTADEVLSVLGFSESAAKAVRAHKCCEGSTLPAALVVPEDLTSDDNATRLRARKLAYQAARQYVMTADPTRFMHWKAIIDQFLDVTKAVIHWVELEDIDVENGGTLIVSANTHAFYANNVRIHGTGRIVCEGNITFKVNSLQGIKPLSGIISQVSTGVKAV